MRQDTRGRLQDYILELERRAAKSQGDARRTLNPLFTRDDNKRPPRDFVDSSFMYMRSCDADTGSRPIPCPVFWLSPDLRVAPLSNLGMPTQSLIAGTTYRFTATVRNRGDLPVPSAKVEFYLCDPTLGFDTRFATKLGVTADRVQAHGAAEVFLDYAIPPSLSGHRCLFARVFSFSPLDLPIDDFALNPVVDRHVAQLNLNIVGQGGQLVLNWIHLPNAADRLEIGPMDGRIIQQLRFESVKALDVVQPERWREVQGRLAIEFTPGDGPTIDTQRTEHGLEIVSRDRDGFPLERQAELTRQVLEALQALEIGRGDAREFKALFREYRAMNARSVRSKLTLDLPDVGLERGQAVGVDVLKRSLVTGEVTGGIGLFVTGG